MGEHFRKNEEKITIGMIVAGIIIIGVLMTSLIVYLINVNKTNVQGDVISDSQEIGETENKDDNFEAVSIDVGKSVNEAANELKESTENSTKTETKNENKAVNSSSNTTKNTKEKEENSKNNTSQSQNTTSNTDTETKKEEIKFSAPIKGEILREFASDSLVYSNTLDEWITHNGVDIKADKTSVVKASCKGKVVSIKNDPRYGLTVIVSHEGGYQTLYANLLTAEYVVEGEELEEGQTIGTVGNSAAFEISDEYHLHFEVSKDGEYLNPCSLMDF